MKGQESVFCFFFFNREESGTRTCTQGKTLDMRETANTKCTNEGRELGQNLDGDLKFRAWVEESDGRSFNSLRTRTGQDI